MRECENCGAEATWKLTFLLPRARANPASSAFGKDDCSWCADDHMFVCDECKPEHNHFARERDMEWCSAFPKDRFPHMFRIKTTAEA